MNAIDPLPEDKSKAPAVDGALDILEALIQSTYPLSLSEIADRVSMPVASCHRIIGTLLRRELVVRDLQRKKSYCVGAKLFQMASAAYFQQPIVSLFHSTADVLKNELHEAVNLTVLAGSHALVVAHVTWPFAETFGVYVGMSHPLHQDAAGKAMMSMRPEYIQKHYWEEFIDGRAHALSHAITLDDWLRDLAEIKRIGYALTRSATAPDTYSLAAPVLNRRGEPLAAMGVCFAAQKDARPYVTPLIQATWQLSSRLG
ncbi:putative Transcriptional regulator [Paraburkholderia piptadeniae]|uniref:Transcriptional regulator n=1 Tax=Paraburkholderia piptadeniae TaxID=1701573 RepID=A0A1N7SGA7_9BURK|nr:IclR family transcriptional regulator [Paraburkholderia piptadeniae]SIT46362.1 putative Transcriptional regulator [Paraburkholderia piptadeniae]